MDSSTGVSILAVKFRFFLYSWPPTISQFSYWY